ncbi:glycosyltransferase family 2 protein [Ottowia caeni]|uniref:glycosyltransferase n=1 Tax=Ottowia caeni TaxID=2870339 RepID=UPI001E3831CC|nr:glycosyltransferase family 2 protein [Ottowia caeni]
MNITVSIVSHGHGAEALALLDELSALTGQGVRRLLLTLNQLEPELASAVRQRSYSYELILIENTSPLGFGANHNRAFARDADLGASEAFAVFNPDLHLRGNPLKGMARALVDMPLAGAVYPRQVDTAGAPSDSERLVPTPRRLLARYLGGRRHEVVDGDRPEWVNAACMLLRREAYEQIGGFDESYHMYCEDVDLCLRLQLAGWSLVRADDAIVEHAAQRASHRNPRHLAWHVASLCKLWGSAAYREWTKSAEKQSYRI